MKISDIVAALTALKTATDVEAGIDAMIAQLSSAQGSDETAQHQLDDLEYQAQLKAAADRYDWTEYARLENSRVGSAG